MDRCPSCNCEVCKCSRTPFIDSKSAIKDLKAEVNALRSALLEIRDVARVSEGVEFYAMLAEKALIGK